MISEKLVIIGSGPAGLTAGLYAARAQLKPLIIEGSAAGGQLMGTTHVENWIGVKSILGPQLMMDMRAHTESFGARFMSETITAVNLSSRPFILTTSKNNTIQAEALIIATGATPKRLGCTGEQEYWGRGVTTCAVCDGAFYRNKKVFIVGGGDTAMEDASFMTKFTDDITIIHILDKLTASLPMQERVLKNNNIKILYESTVTEITGDGKHITHITVQNQRTKETQLMEADCVFVAIGLSPNTAVFRGQLELDKIGYIIQKNHTQTSVEGVFAAGDVTDHRYRQAITSAGSGCMAALDAENFLKDHE